MIQPLTVSSPPMRRALMKLMTMVLVRMRGWVDRKGSLVDHAGLTNKHPDSGRFDRKVGDLRRGCNKFFIKRHYGFIIL